MNTHPNQSREALPPDEVMLEPAGQFAADLRTAQHRVVLAWSLVTVCAALLCIGALPFLHHLAPPVTAHQVVPVQPVVIDDTALLEQVDTAVSESVPTPLAPLATLDDLSSTTSTNTESSLNAPEKKNVAQ